MDADNQIAAALRPLMVLAADDNAANRLMLKTALDLFGFCTTVVDDGAEALATWSGGAFDLILLDIEMPRMDGPAALAAIRAVERARGMPRTPAIAFSGHQSEDLLGGCLGDFDLYVGKPVALSQLRIALDAAAALMRSGVHHMPVALRDVV
jgi:CheY-like chemotaxis protein